MDLHETAASVIKLAEDQLDPCFSNFPEVQKYRETDPGIFSESLRYDLGFVLITVTACLHPHDYPNTIDVSVFDKGKEPFRYMATWELVQFAAEQCKLPVEELYIVTDAATIKSVNYLGQLIRCYLEKRE